MVRGELMELPRDPAIKIESKRKVQKGIEPLTLVIIVLLRKSMQKRLMSQG